nr:uncharacterized protein LOC126531431 isoform X2 [Dermacentor andersoni]
MLCAYSLTLATVFAFNGRPTTQNFGTMLSLAGCQEMTEANELASAVTMAMSGNRNTCAALWCTPSSLDPPKMTGVYAWLGGLPCFFVSFGERSFAEEISAFHRDVDCSSRDVMHAHEIETLVTCSKAHADMPEKVLNHWNDQMAMFTGMSDAEVVLLICKTSLDAGEALPEHKTTIDMITTQCYEKATGQKIA